MKKTNTFNLMMLLVATLLFLVSVFFPNTKVYAKDTLKAGFAFGRSGGVSIDGYYDDWEDKPISHITYGSHNGKTIHDVSLIKDDEFTFQYGSILSFLSKLHTITL